MARELWCEKYRPNKISEYVFRDKGQKKQVEAWLAEGVLPTLLLSGSAGVGKTSLAKMMLKELEVDPGDIKIINGSTENGVDYIREVVTNFSSSMPYGDFKYILLDEADGLSANAQAALRHVIEKFSNSVRFIFTANYPDRIIPALHSRCQGFHIVDLDKNDFTMRVAEILVSENIESDIDTLDTFISNTYPDMRKCLNTVQQNSVTGKLELPNVEEISSDDYRIAVTLLLKERKFYEARSLISKQIRPGEYESFYRFLYNNLDIWGMTRDQENKAIIQINEGLYKHAIVADPEINLVATITEIILISEENNE